MRLKHTGSILLAIIMLLLMLATIADLGPLPSWLLGLEHPQSSHLSSYQQLQLEQAIRTTVLQAIGGLLLVSGAIATWRQVTTASQTLALNRSIRATDVFAKAIEQLGSAGLATRIGGIYALDRIARDEPLERQRIGDLLATFIRQPPSAPLSEIQADIQAALTVLTSGKYASLFLDNARLRGASLIQSNLISASLRHTVLARADLSEANLTNACLTGADLRDANLSSADLRGANLVGADLTGTKLDNVQSDSRTLWPSS